MAIYHTAGKGTRLAPLPGAENNNKPGRSDWLELEWLDTWEIGLGRWISPVATIEVHTSEGGCSRAAFLSS